ncbi:hypothetical protein [Achromobacter insuavis]|uniref:hypothetical protein n=1 Tax=Achromobacter insuavis TaxID=1287735 RepID=UPI001F138711|nr:hypothetical protein [Achromobacter insuavis]
MHNATDIVAVLDTRRTAIATNESVPCPLCGASVLRLEASGAKFGDPLTRDVNCVPALNEVLSPSQYCRGSHLVCFDGGQCHGCGVYLAFLTAMVVDSRRGVSTAELASPLDDEVKVSRWSAVLNDGTQQDWIVEETLTPKGLLQRHILGPWIVNAAELDLRYGEAPAVTGRRLRAGTVWHTARSRLADIWDLISRHSGDNPGLRAY